MSEAALLAEKRAENAGRAGNHLIPRPEDRRPIYNMVVLATVIKDKDLELATTSVYADDYMSIRHDMLAIIGKTLTVRSHYSGSKDVVDITVY